MMLQACSGDYLDTEDRSALEPDAVAEAAGRNPDIFLNGMWAWTVDFGTLTATNIHDCYNTAFLLVSDCMSENMAFSASHWFNYDYQFDFPVQVVLDFRPTYNFFGGLLNGGELYGFDPYVSMGLRYAF